MRRRIAPMDTWPQLVVAIHLLPWSWRRPRIYWDDIEGPLTLSYIEFGPLRIEWGGQRGGWREQFTYVEREESGEPEMTRINQAIAYMRAQGLPEPSREEIEAAKRVLMGDPG